MREIKYRIYDEKGRKMLPFDYLVKFAVLGLVFTKEIQYKVMQYTDLKDKNGVEVYEGDILTKKSFWPFYIGFENGCFVQIPCNKTKRKNRLEFSRINTYVKEFEVVGNIYENPELLEVQNG